MVASVSAIGFDSISGFVVNEKAQMQRRDKDEQPGRAHRLMRAQATPKADAAASLMQTSESSVSESEHSLGLHASTLRLFNASRPPQNSHAIVSHICDDDWAPGVIALGGSLKKFQMPLDLVLMVSSNVSLPVRTLLSSIFHSVYVEEPVTPHPAIQRKGGDCVTLQLRTWQLPYKKALYMDADMIALSSPASVFAKFGELTAQMDKYEQFNGGMFLCEPSAETFDVLAQKLKTFPKQRRVGIQPFMNFAFPKCNDSSSSTSPRQFGHAGCWRETFDPTQNKFSRSLNQSDLQRILAGEPVYGSVHFSGDWASRVKPWQLGCLAARDSSTRDDNLRKDVLDLWLHAFNSTKLPPGMEQFVDVQCPAFTCAEAQKTLDYVMLAENLDCITNATVNSLYQYASPRQVLLVAPAHVCAQHSSEVANGTVDKRSRCFDEDTLLEGMTRAQLESWLAERHGRSAKSSQMARWLLQKIIKLGLAEASSKLDLGENYVIWDASTVLLRDFCPFNKDGQANLMESAMGPEGACAARHREVFLQLTGMKYQYSVKRNLTFSSNHLVVNKRSMSEFLASFQGNRSDRSHVVQWSKTMFDAACPTIDDCACGFPGIAAYASWLKLRKPESISEVPRQFVDARDFDLIRQRGSIRPGVIVRTPCCPSEHRSDLDKRNGHLAVRFNRTSTCRGPLAEKYRWKPPKGHPVQDNSSVAPAAK
jgi:hypothetical protein